MTLTAELYFSFRSPYSYLSVGRYRAMAEEYDLDIALRPVWPLAIREPDFFERNHPNWLAYTLRDMMRVAQFHGIPFGPPRPDPIVQDAATRKIAAEQISSIVQRELQLAELQSAYDAQMTDLVGWIEAQHAKFSGGTSAIEPGMLAETLEVADKTTTDKTSPILNDLGPVALPRIGKKEGFYYSELYPHCGCDPTRESVESVVFAYYRLGLGLRRRSLRRQGGLRRSASAGVAARL